MEQIEAAFANFKGEPQKLKLPSAPSNPIVVRHEKNRPQPRFDRDTGCGMSVVSGQDTQGSDYDFQVHVPWDITLFVALQAEAFLARSYMLRKA